MEPIEVEVVGLKCDNPTCGHIINNVPESKYESYVGRPCPACGEMILSQAEYDNYLKMKGAAKKVNMVLGIAKWASPSTYWDLLMGRKV